MPFRTVIFGLLGVALVLVVAFLVVGVLYLFLSAVGDADGAAIVRVTAVTLIVLLAVDLICLVLALAADSAGRPDNPPPTSPDERPPR